MSLQQLLVKRAGQILKKSAFQPMPGGQPPADPNAGGAPAGAPPMDPSMMGGAPAGAPPMDPAMMGGAPGGMPMDPSMGGMMPPGMGMMGAGGPPPATVGQLSVTDFQTIMTDMLTSVLSQIMGGGAAPAGADIGMPPPETAPQDNKRTISNTEISDKLDSLMALLGDSGAAPGAGAPVGEPAPGGGTGLGFGGVSAGGAGAGAVAPAGGGMEIQAGAHQGRKNSLADVILKKAAQARKA